MLQMVGDNHRGFVGVVNKRQQVLKHAHPLEWIIHL